MASRSGRSGKENANRPLSQSHSSLTSRLSRARCRTTSPRRVWTNMLQPDAQSVQIESPRRTSNGRAANRYVVAVSAPTGQIWTVFPENGLSKSSPGAMAICSAAPRSNSSMKRSPGDLVAEPGAALAQDAALPVQVDQRRERERLAVGSLRLAVARLAGAERQRLILQRALPSPVADRAVERMVDQEELEHRLLRVPALRVGELAVHDHSLGDRGRTRRHQLALALDAHVALAAGGDRREQRVVAEPRDLDPQVLGRPDEQRSLRHGHGVPSIVRFTSGSRGRRSSEHLVQFHGGGRQRAPSRFRPRRLAPDGRRRSGGPVRDTGHRPRRRCSSYSSRKYLIDESIGDDRSVGERAERLEQHVPADVLRQVDVLRRGRGRLRSVGGRVRATTFPRGNSCIFRTTRARRTA